MAITALSLDLAALAAKRHDLIITGWVLELAALLLGLSILLVFEAELRSALLRFDAFFVGRSPAPSPDTGKLLAEAVFQLASARLGSLIVVRGRDSVADMAAHRSALRFLRRYWRRSS